MTGYPSGRGNATDSHTTSSNAAVLDSAESSAEHSESASLPTADRGPAEELASGFFRKTRPGAEYWLG